MLERELENFKREGRCCRIDRPGLLMLTQALEAEQGQGYSVVTGSKTWASFLCACFRRGVVNGKIQQKK